MDNISYTDNITEWLWQQRGGVLNRPTAMGLAMIIWGDWRGMTLMHETFHTLLGGSFTDAPNLIHPQGTVVANMNHIRSDLNAQGGNDGQRLSYIAWATSPQHNAYVPFSLTAKMTMELKLELSLPLKYIWFKP